MFYRGCDQQGYNADCDDDNEYWAKGWNGTVQILFVGYKIL
jgi:hypothetical protein